MQSSPWPQMAQEVGLLDVGAERILECSAWWCCYHCGLQLRQGDGLHTYR